MEQDFSRYCAFCFSIEMLQGKTGVGTGPASIIALLSPCFRWKGQNMIASTNHLLLYTSARMSDCLSEQTRHNVARYAAAGPQVLDQRLKELANEFWAERAATVGLTLLALVSLSLIPLGSIWLVVPGLLLTLLLLQTGMAWSPVLPLLRGLGYRTACEIWSERFALKALRGDFQRLDRVTTPQDREDLSRFESEGGPAPLDAHPDAGDLEIVHAAVKAAQS